MATLDKLTVKARLWDEHATHCRKIIMRAAGVQARQYELRDPTVEAQRLVDLYAIREKKKDWQEYGDVAFHIVAEHLLGLHIHRIGRLVA